MIRALLRALAIVAGVAFATPAIAHASLLSTSPPDGAVLGEAPAAVVLTFNEPVSPVDVKLFDAEGVAFAASDARSEGNTLIAHLPEGLGRGTLTVSWRAISVDSHPVGGVFSFSVGASTPAPPIATQGDDRLVGTAVWAGGLIFIGSLLVGVGGAFFLAWLAPRARRSPAARPVLVAIGLGLALAPLTIGLQGADTLGQGLATLAGGVAWRAGLFSTYGATVLTGEIALGLALAAILLAHRAAVLAASAVALAALGVAFVVSGHASGAPPHEVAWLAVLVHGVAAAFWVGALAPLAGLLATRHPEGRAALRRFSAAIPFAIVPLVAGGAILATLQLTKPSDLWTTAYGTILSAKLAAVTAMFTLAAYNRWRLTVGAGRGEARSTARLAASIRIEWVLMAVVIALVAGWRLTVPPRSLFAGAPAEPPLYAMPASADGATMANVNLLPGRIGRNDVLVQVTDRRMSPVGVLGVTVSLENAEAGIAPITRAATKVNDTLWRVDGIAIPTAAVWTVAVDVLVSEFSQVRLEARVAIGG